MKKLLLYALLCSSSMAFGSYSRDDNGNVENHNLTSLELKMSKAISKETASSMVICSQDRDLHLFESAVQHKLLPALFCRIQVLESQNNAIHAKLDNLIALLAPPSAHSTAAYASNLSLTVDTNKKSETASACAPASILESATAAAPVPVQPPHSTVQNMPAPSVPAKK